MCGSEGTLGIVTEATVRLRPPPAEAATLAASFPTLRGAGDAIARIAREQRPSLLELMDRRRSGAVEAFQPQDLDPDAAAMVFARADDGRAESLAAVAAMERICEACGADLVVTSDEEAEGRMLMAARRLAFTGARAPRRDAARRRRRPARRDPGAARRLRADRATSSAS